MNYLKQNKNFMSLKKSLLIFIFSLLTICNFISAEITINKETTFTPLNNIKIVDVVNEKGNLFIEGWDNDSIKIETSINFQTDSRKTATELTDNMSFVQNVNGSTFNITYKPANNHQINTPYSVNYIIKIPNKPVLKAKCSHGQLSISNFKSIVYAELEYGNLEFNNLSSSSENEIIINSSTANINTCNKLKIEAENCQLNMKHCNETSINSLYTSLNIRNIKELKATSDYNKFSIKNADHIEIKGIGSKIDINNLQKYGLIEIEKGEVKVQNLSLSINELNIANIQSPIEVHVKEIMPFFINGQNNQGGFQYPWPDKIRIIQDLSTTSFSGQNGAVNSLSPKLILFNQQSSIQIIKE